MAHKTINFFEFNRYSWEYSPELSTIKNKRKFSVDFEDALEKIWENRNRFIINTNNYYNSDSNTQRIVDFKKDEIIPRNWIGTIYFSSGSHDYEINLLPKILYDKKIPSSSIDTKSAFAHVLWWLSVSDKQNYSSLSRASSAMNSNLLEIMIHVFSHFTLNLLSTSTYNYYENITEDLESVRGQIDFNGYSSNYARSNKHIISCSYDSFQFDNLFNRIIKYVCTLLYNTTQNKISKKNLEELLFILDKVTFKEFITEDCNKVSLNPIYTEFKTVLDYCRLFLSSMSIFKWKDDLDVFALLIPSEKLFENFIFSVLKQNSGPLIDNVSTKKPGRNYLVRQLPTKTYTKYQMLNDMVVSLKNGTYILFDMKYKRIFTGTDNNSLDTVYNISQSDIYQMVSYAVGSGVNNIGLIYPSMLSYSDEYLPVYEIKDELSLGKVIRIYPFKVDIIHSQGLSLDTSITLDELFRPTFMQVSQQLNSIVEKIIEFKATEEDLGL